MVIGTLALLAIPVILIVLLLIKSIIKLPFSILKILVVIFVVWIVITAVNGGFSDVISSISQPQISQKDGKLNYTLAFNENVLDLAAYPDIEELEVNINSILSTIKLKVPENCIISLTVNGAGVTIVKSDGTEETLPIGTKKTSVGSGSRIIYMTLNGAFMKLIQE